MERKDKIYCGIIAVLLLLWIFSNIEIEKPKEPEPKKNRTERYVETCEYWQVCDYRSSFCPAYYTNMFEQPCEDKYSCEYERRNCKPDCDILNSTFCNLTLNFTAFPNTRFFFVNHSKIDLPNFDNCNITMCDCYEKFGCMAKCYKC